MRAFSTVFGLVGVAALAAGCAAASGDAAQESASAAQDLSTSATTFVKVSTPECIKAPCPPYLVQDLNKTTGGRAVGNLDFSGTGFTKVTIADITSAPVGEIVLRGKLGPVQAKTNLPSFIVSEAYRGMPGIVYDPTTPFYQGGDYSPPVECFVAPCPEGSVSELNVPGAAVAYTSIDVSAAAVPYANQAFLRQEIASNHAIVVASFLVSSQVGAGTSRTLEAQQVFLKMPAAMGGCPTYQLPACPSGQERTYTRDANLCDVPGVCVTPGICSHLRPSCAVGYTQSTWISAPNACPAFGCDPTFVVAP